MYVYIYIYIYMVTNPLCAVLLQPNTTFFAVTASKMCQWINEFNESAKYHVTEITRFHLKKYFDSV